MTDLLRRVPPQNIEAEQSVLGAVLIAPRADEDVVATQAKVLAHATALISPEDFYAERHQEIFRAMVALAEAKSPIDAITLTDALKGRNVIEAVGGPGYIAELAAVVPTAASVGFYARIVREKSVLRSLATQATEIASLAYDAGGAADVAGLLADAEARITSVARSGLGDPEPPLDQAMRDLLVSVERGELAGVPTGFASLDRALTAGGLSRGSLNIIGATTSVGKTSLATNIAIGAQRGGTLFLSCEMTREEMIRRMIGTVGLVDWSRIARRRPPLPDAEESQKIATAVEQILSTPLNVLYRRRLTPAEVRRAARLALPEFDGKLDLIVVDYLQLMDPDVPQKRRDLEIASITKALKNYAGELDVPIVLLSQINREGAKAEQGEPQLWHLRDSGAIEQDADVVIFLWESRKEGVSRSVEINWKIAKQRNGPKLQLAPLRFRPEFTMFSTVSV